VSENDAAEREVAEREVAERERSGEQRLKNRLERFFAHALNTVK